MRESQSLNTDQVSSDSQIVRTFIEVSLDESQSLNTDQVSSDIYDGDTDGRGKS